MSRKIANSLNMNMAELAVLFAPPEGATHTGLMFALPVPEEVATRLVVKGGEKPESLHVTLAYCGDVSELTDEAIAAAVMCAKNISQNWQPLNGKIGGIGRFNASDSSEGKDVIYASVDVPGLESMRERLVSHLREVGCPPLANHGFTPHITLAYVEQGSKSPIEKIETIPVEFSNLLIALGDKSNVYPFETPNHYPANMDYSNSTVFPLSDEVEFAHGDNFLFIELAKLTNGKPFAGFTVGEFTDMFGRAVKISADKFKTFLTNTSKAIDLMKKRGMPGLPIDEKLHDKGHAAGWITEAKAGEITDNKGTQRPALFFAVDWTSLGVNLIGEKIQTNFSPTVDLQNSVIRGGSLTNWPATLDENGIPLFNALELSQNLYQVIPQAQAENPPSTPQHKEKTMTDQIVELSDEVLTARLSPLIESAVAASLTKVLAAQGFGTAPAKPDPATSDYGELAQLLNLDKLEAGAQTTIEAILSQHVKSVQEAAELQYMQKLATANHKRIVTELSARVTGGTPDAPRGLPIKSDELTAALLKLPREQYPFWADLMQTIVEVDLTDFRELGHGREQKQGTRNLEPAYKNQLAKFVKEGGTVDEFFAINAEFMDFPQAEYNLSEFAQKEK